MTITAVAQPDNVPPRVLVTVSVPSGVMSAVSVWRDDSYGRTFLRQQPTTGFAERSTFDYEAPFGQSVVYGWTVTYGATTVTEFASPVTLESDDAWLIAPQSPALSFPLAKADADRAGVFSVGAQQYKTNTTVHEILGTSVPVTTTSGPRQAQMTSLAVRTTTPGEREALAALVAPDVPILVNVPPAWSTGFPFAYFQVGDVTIDRPIPAGVSDLRVFTLPLTQVRTPVVDVAVEWTYADVAATWGSYATVQARYATYADLIVDVRV
jgi:hypothetical protein